MKGRNGGVWGGQKKIIGCKGEAGDIKCRKSGRGRAAAGDGGRGRRGETIAEKTYRLQGIPGRRGKKKKKRKAFVVEF